MGRIRTIKPEFVQSESVGRLSREARLLFIQLWTICDDEGRARAASRMLASLLYPYDNDAPTLIDDWLQELESQDCIARYECDGNVYLQVRKWLIHQKIDRPSRSRIPPFDESSRKLARAREASTTDLGSRIMDLGSRIMDLNPSSERKNGSDPEEILPAAKTARGPSQQASRLAVLLEQQIHRNKVDFRITEKQVREWSLTADRMLRLDRRTPEQIENLIRWVQKDEFWMANILSMSKLREKFDQLELKRRGGNNGSAQSREQQRQAANLAANETVRAAIMAR
jgi:hypothetical protein